jgi:hypothetical protein
VTSGGERARLAEELERRLVELERAGDEELGRFTRWDWVLVVLTSLVLPYLIVWWFA